MTSSTNRSGTRPANYRAPLADNGSAEETERQIALAWASLAAEREAFPQLRRVIVLRRVIF
jgi:hypothetical protein